MGDAGLLRVAVVLGSLGGAALVVRVVRDVALRRSLLDHPNDRSSHTVPRPRLGGIGVVLPLLAMGGWLVAAGRAPPALLLPLAATGVVAVLGLVDDLRPLPARLRLAVQVLAATSVVSASWDRLPAAAGSLGGGLPPAVLAPLAVLWIAWLTNLYNFMDGIDGLAGVQALLAALALASVASGAGAGASEFLLLALAGGAAGFLVFNLPPSSIFMGDVGSTAVGFFLGVLPLLPEVRPVAFEPVALALSLFFLDATTTLARRIAKGERWYAPHRTHLYQRPVAAGLGHRSVLLAATVGMAAVAACAAAWPGARPSARLVLGAAPFVAFGVGWVTVLAVERARAQ